MNALRKFHRWLEALPERTKIVGLVALIVLIVGAPIGVFGLAAAVEGPPERPDISAESDAYIEGWGDGEGHARANNPFSYCAEIVIAAGGYDYLESYGGSEWRRGCEDGWNYGIELADYNARQDEGDSSEAATEQVPTDLVMAVDGTPVPAEAVSAYEHGKAVGAEIREEIAAGLTGTYAEGDNGVQRFFEDTRDERNPYPDRSDDPQNYWYELGAWEQSGLYDGSGQVVYEDGQTGADAPDAGRARQDECAKKGPAYKLPVDDPCFHNADNPAKANMPSGDADAPADPFYESIVRESGMTEAELEPFFQRAVENGRFFAREYGDHAQALAACTRLVTQVSTGAVVPPQVAALPTLDQQFAALAALGQVASQGCTYGVGAELSGS